MAGAWWMVDGGLVGRGSLWVCWDVYGSDIQTLYISD